eukprot:s3107_g8.t1
MPTIGLQNVDMEERAAQIFDNALMAKILQMFPFYYNQRVVMSPKEYYDKMVKNEIGRVDLDGICPYTGEDDEGNLKYPPDEAIREWFDQKASKDRQRPTNGCDSRKVSDATTASELSCEEKQKVLAKDAKGAKGKKPRGGKP